MGNFHSSLHFLNIGKMNLNCNSRLYSSFWRRKRRRRRGGGGRGGEEEGIFVERCKFIWREKSIDVWIFNNVLRVGWEVCEGGGILINFQATWNEEISFVISPWLFDNLSISTARALFPYDRPTCIRVHFITFINVSSVLLLLSNIDFYLISPNYDTSVTFQKTWQRI